MKEHHSSKHTPEKKAHEAPDAAPAETAREPSAGDALAATKEQVLRLQADFDNFRKRTARERNEIYQRASEDLMQALLPVLDHYELGLKSAESHKADNAVVDGFRMVHSQLMDALGKAGLVPFDAEGQPFDPHQHEALSRMPSAEVPADTVIAQTRRGYRLGDRLLRPAQVVVSTGSGTDDDAAPEPILWEEKAEADKTDTGDQD